MEAYQVVILVSIIGGLISGVICCIVWFFKFIFLLVLKDLPPDKVKALCKGLGLNKRSIFNFGRNSINNTSIKNKQDS